MDRVLEKTETYLIYTLLFLFPITALSISPNPFVVSKISLLVYGVGALLLVKIIRIITSGKLEFNVGRYDLPVALIAVAYILSTLLRTPNKMEALLLPGTTTAVVGGALLYFLVNQLKTNAKKQVGLVLVASGVVFSLLSLLAFAGLFDKIPQLPAYIRSKSFTPEGGFLPAAIFLGTMLPIALGIAFAEKDQTKKILVSIGTAVMIFGLAVSIYNLLPGRPFAPRFPSASTSWQIAVDALKESPLLGVGAGNYLTAFNRFRPVAYNLTDLWAIKFATASDMYLTVLAEVGMLGLLGFVILLVSFYKDAQKDIKERKLVHWGFAGVANVLSLGLLFLLFAFFPATILLIVELFVLLALNARTKETSLNLMTQGADNDAQGFSKEQVASRFPALLITIPVAVLVGLAFVRTAVILQAEYKFKKSLDALVANEAAPTYDLMRGAIQLNPTVDRYHATFSRINLILANAIAAKKDLQDSDRANITQLIQQSISEGKATVALNPLRAGNWEVLARTYQTIIPFAQGADAFSVQTFRQAIALDPLNPNLRIALGGIYYSRKDYDNAINIFGVVTTTVKPDLANAHYNLAFALKEKGNIDAAVQEMTNVLSLITDKNSQDYTVAKQVLDDLQAKQKELKAANSDNLTAPEKAGQPAINPQIKLDENAKPPQAPITSTPTPSVKPPTVSPTP